MIPLPKTLRAGSLVAVAIGSVFVTRVFTETQGVARVNAGAAVVVSMALAAVVLVLAALCYSEFSGLLPVAGGAYSYTYVAFGRSAGWLMGWNLMFVYATGCAGAANGWSGHMNAFLRHMGIRLSDRWAAGPFEPLALPDGRMIHGSANVPAALITVLAFLLLMAGARIYVRLIAATVIVKIAALLAFVVMCWRFIDWSNFGPFIPANTGAFGSFGFSGILMGIGPLVLAFLSFDVVTMTAEDCENPRTAMPRAILGGIAICAVIYILFAVVLTGVVNYRTIAGDMSVAQAVEHTPYTWINDLTRLGLITGYASVVLALLLGLARLLFAMSRDRQLPLGTSPSRANLQALVVVAPMAAFMPSRIPAHAASVAVMLAFAVVSAGVWVMRAKHPGLERSFRVPVVPAVATLGILSFTAMIAWLGWNNIKRLIIWLIIGQIVYFVHGWYRSRQAKGQEAAVPAQGSLQYR